MYTTNDGQENIPPCIFATREYSWTSSLDSWMDIAECEPFLWIVTSRTWWCCFIFYMFLSLYVRRVATFFATSWTDTAEKRVRILAVSFFHACSATCLALAAHLGYAKGRDVAMHTAAYFVANVIMQFHWIYIPHHVASLIATEIYLRHGCDFQEWITLGGWFEAGNAVSHGSLLWPVWRRAPQPATLEPPFDIGTFLFILSRIIGLVYFWQESPCYLSLPLYTRTNEDLRLVYLIAFHALFWSNVVWIIILSLLGPRIQDVLL